MKTKRLTLLLLLCALLLCGSGIAEGTLSVRLSGDALAVDWDSACSARCTLTLYMDGWPMEVVLVEPRGSMSYPVSDASRRYSARLKVPGGCLTAEAVTEQAPEPAADPTPVPTANPTLTPVATPSGSSYGDLAAQVVAQVNDERAKVGLNALRVDDELTRAAKVRAGEIVQKFSHTRPDGTPWSTVSASAYGENIAMGQQTVDKVMAAWMSSQGHRENILRAGYGSIGVCAYMSDGILYWVQLFGQ